MRRMNSQDKKKVFVGMSGGVDSSVSAALLQRDGYDVTGVFMRVWQPDWLDCNWREDRLDAMRVAAHLGIPFITLDLEKEYKKEVVDYMIAEYKKGRTPNPDVMCNRHVKFGGFFDWAMKNGADYVATGHYAKVLKNAAANENIFELHAGDDQNKDQSYFLWTLGQRELSKTFFPVGNMEKPMVRDLARKFGLPNAEKKDSQGLCFIGKIDVKEFLSHYIDKKPGKVLNSAGEVIGTHDGAWQYTFGERHGFTITKKTPNDTPYYVVGKDIEANTITVSQKDQQESPDNFLPNARKEILISNVNWTTGEMLETKTGTSLVARARYRETLTPIKVVQITENKKGITAEIHFDAPQETLSPGQSLVIYESAQPGALCLGGGIIE